MKTIEEITNEVRLCKTWYKQYNILEDWAKEIIDECAAEVREEPWQITKEAVLAIKDVL